MKQNRIAVTLAAGASAAVLALAGCNPNATTSGNGDGGGGGSSSEKKTSEQANEQKDLLSFTLDDRSASGLTDIWVTWEIKNHSSKPSDYTWDWEAIDKSTGKRVANSTEFVTGVQPGQTDVGEMFTELKTPDVKLNITNFDRTESY